MDLPVALDFARENTKSVLVTLRKDGKPQLSNVWHAVGDDGLIRVSITADRAKYHNLKRAPWGAIHASRSDFNAYVVLEGAASLSAVASAPDDEAVEELVALYRSLGGEHPDWDDYRATMVRDRRVVARIRPDHAYGMAG